MEALSRIERAFDRIEAVTSRPVEKAAASTSEETERLREAHDALRRRVAGAIGQIDRLIEAGRKG